MAKEPQDAIMEALGRIESTLAAHDRRLQELADAVAKLLGIAEFERLRIDRRSYGDADIGSLAPSRTGRVRRDDAFVADVKHRDEVELELRDIRARLRKLEEKV